MDSKDREQFGMPTTPQTGIFSNPDSLSTPNTNGGVLASNPQVFPQTPTRYQQSQIAQTSILSGEESNSIFVPEVKKPKKTLTIIIAILAIIIIGIGAALYFVFFNTKTGNNKSAINNYIEYFVYGTENGQNTINDDSFNISIDEYAAVACSVEYCNKLVEKFDVIKFNNEQAKKYQGDLLLFYVISSKVLYDNQLDVSYETTFDDSLLASSYSIMTTYIDDTNEKNYKSLRRQNQLVYQILAKSLNALYAEEK